MNPRIALWIVPALLVGLALGAASSAPRSDGPRLAHMVFFTMKDRSAEARTKFLASCQKHLSGHPGVESFSLGTMAEDVVEPVSVRDFDVALHLVFESKAAEADYLKSPRHDAFVSENKGIWSQVRVFDSYLAPSK